jgi:hypothetical protein
MGTLVHPGGTHDSYDHRYNYQFLRNSYRLRGATLSTYHT